MKVRTRRKFAWLPVTLYWKSYTTRKLYAVPGKRWMRWITYRYMPGNGWVALLTDNK